MTGAPLKPYLDVMLLWIAVTALQLDTKPILGMRPGTSGLRKKTKVWRDEPMFTLNFCQALMDGWVKPAGVKTLVVGGDGRYYSLEALERVCQVAAANGVERLVVPVNGVVSTPGASALVRTLKADGAVLLTASHNPGGEDGDFGIKFNTADGSPAREVWTEAVYDQSRELSSVQYVDVPIGSLDEPGERAFGPASLQIIDDISVYVDQLKQCFDFEALKAKLEGKQVLIDAMHGAAGPAAVRVFDELGCRDAVMRSEPLPDFGGCHPDPNLKWAHELRDKCGIDASGKTIDAEQGPWLGAALDGDGDRNMILGKGCFVTPSDSLAVLCARADRIPWFSQGLKAVARSMPTSRALDRVASKLGVTCFETPTGWKYFGNLMEAHSPFLCGEESFGTGSNHVREKDGLWAVLAWLSILNDNEQISDVLRAHWSKFGRDLYARYDYEAVDAQGADAMFDHLRGLGDDRISEFSYVDPVDGSTATKQGIILNFDDTDERAVFRLSGTGSQGATVRLYLEKYIAEPTDADLDATPALELTHLAKRAIDIASLEAFIKRQDPDVIT